MYKNTDTYEYLIYFLHEFISFKDMLSYKELNYDVYRDGLFYHTIFY